MESKLSYSELVEILANLKVEQQRQSEQIKAMVDHINWLNKEIASWGEFITTLSLTLWADMGDKRSNRKRIDECEQVVKSFITYAQSDSFLEKIGRFKKGVSYSNYEL